MSHTTEWAARLAWAAVPNGHAVEFGVFRGATLRLLDAVAREVAPTAVVWGLDTFAGMPEHGPRDVLQDGTVPYPRGRLAGPSVEALRAALDAEGRVRCGLIRGEVPATLDCLESEMHGDPLAYVYLDLDHYAATLAVLRWARARLAVGGVILCDDYLPRLATHQGRLATGAIQQWTQEVPVEEYATLDPPDGSSRIAFRRR